MGNGQSGKFGIGIIFVCIGGLLILSNLGVVPSFGRLMSLFWPLIIIIISLLFHFGYYSNRNHVGLLVPGGILLTVGIVCQTSMLWNLWGFMWPGFILAPAVGLFELYAFGNREKGLLIPVGILSGLSLIFFSMSFHRLGVLARYMIPAIMILAGVVIVAKNRRYPGEYDDPKTEPNHEDENHQM